jgi:hypothetical protein
MPTSRRQKVPSIGQFISGFAMGPTSHDDTTVAIDIECDIDIDIL